MHAAETSDSGPVFLLFPSYFSSPSSSFNYLNLLFLFVLVGFLFFPFFLLFFFTFSVLFCCETAGFIFFSLSLLAVSRHNLPLHVNKQGGTRGALGAALAHWKTNSAPWAILFPIRFVFWRILPSCLLHSLLEWFQTLCDSSGWFEFHSNV